MIEERDTEIPKQDYYLDANGNDIIDSAFMASYSQGRDFCYWSIQKYLRRAGKKPGASRAEDVDKAQRFLDRWKEKTTMTKWENPIFAQLQRAIDALRRQK